ncbi:hypothetical protein AVEN_120725-1 [Araneus ventricosus]|uniref:Uncharacterized protein n=1 Tax=Araneus ventricosus TaxID=182803 RepID=A0A4Y2SUA7_ARAVE|nr:hypothetical protein AVEN_120725-1 [Araneus ventricosus]
MLFDYDGFQDIQRAKGDEIQSGEVSYNKLAEAPESPMKQTQPEFAVSELICKFIAKTEPGTQAGVRSATSPDCRKPRTLTD